MLKDSSPHAYLLSNLQPQKASPMTRHRTTRREFVAGAASTIARLAVANEILSKSLAAEGGVPASNPMSGLDLPWTDRLAWGRAIDISTVAGDGWDERLEQAQQTLSAGGGVVYFPPGLYEFRHGILSRDRIILRGADPAGATSAHDAGYAPFTRLEFPRYQPQLSGEGTAVETAFKGITLADPATASNCGLVNLSINRGHIHLGESEDHRVGSNRFVFGCTLQNAAVATPVVPDLTIGQHAWQRYTHGHWAAIDIKADRGALAANNRLIKSTDSFAMPGYVVLDRGKDAEPVALEVVFDYDNRPGIKVNHYCVGAPGGEEPSGTPESHPWGFRKGTVIRDNYVYSTGRTAIGFSGDGTECINNVIRFEKDVWRPTNEGRRMTSGSSTNDNRAVEMRGWRWRVEENDYEVHRNWAADRKYHINDGEGLMHENHCNAAILDSRLVNNRGNAYLSLYKTGGIDGLRVEGNEIRVEPRIKEGLNQAVAIFVDADHSPEHHGACRRVSILGNTTAGGILLGGDPSEKNIIQGNRNIEGTAVIRKRAQASIEDNAGYEVVEP